MFSHPPRKDKTVEPDTTLRDRWAAKAAAAGHQPSDVTAAALNRARPSVPPRLDQLAAQLLGPAGLTAQATGFDHRDLLQALCQTLPASLDVDRAGSRQSRSKCWTTATPSRSPPTALTRSRSGGGPPPD